MNDNVTELEFKTMEGTQGNMTINGVPVEQKIKIEVATCKNCKNVLVQFEPNQPLKSRMEYIEHNMKGNINYCPKCGYKINYGGCQIIDAECSVINVKNNN